MTKYTWNRDRMEFVDSDGNAMEAPDRLAMPRIKSDIESYISPVTNKLIDGRSAQREDLKRAGCRLQDPSEHTVHTCRTKKWARKLRKDVENLDAPRLADSI